jgi:hypothetical protein
VTKVVIKAADGTGAVESYHNANKKLETTSAGVTVTGNIAVTGTVDGRDVAADGTKLDGIASSATSVGGATGVDFNDNVKARFGTGNDLEVYHDASHSYISDVGTGDLKITSNGGQVVFQKGSSETLAAFATDNSCELYYDNSLKFTTLSDGAKTYGRHVIDGDLFLDNGSHAGKDIYWDASEKFMRWEDGVEAKFGGGGDLRIYHNGTDAYINNQGDGHVFIRGDDVKIQDANAGHDMGVFIEDGAVELYYDNAKKLETTSWGVDCQGNTRTSGDFVCVDSGKFRAGNSSDLQIYHDGTHSYITNATNALKIKGDLIRLNSSTGDEMMLAAHLDGAVELYHNDAKKLETTSSGVKITSSAIPVIQVVSTGSNRADVRILAEGTGDAFLWFDASNGDLSGADYAFIQHKNSDLDLLIANYANDVIIQTRNGSSGSGSLNTAIHCHENGAAELFYDGTAKAYTTANGLIVRNSLSVSNNPNDSYYGLSTTYNYIHTNQSSAPCAIFEHSNDNNPQGVYIYFSDDSPDNNTKYFLSCDDNAGARARIYSDGDMWTADAATLTSDETLKENITDATSKLEDLKKLKVRNFNWKASYHPEKSKKKQIGFIAQEVEEVFPALVNEYDIATGVHDDNHTPLMKKAIKQAWDPIIIKAMQELITKVETLETKVSALEAG